MIRKKCLKAPVGNNEKYLRNANIHNAYSLCMDGTKTNIDEMRWHDKQKHSMKKKNKFLFFFPTPKDWRQNYFLWL